MKHFLLFYSIILITSLSIYMDITNYDGRLEPIENISAVTWYDVTLENSENIEIFHNMIATSATSDSPDTIDFNQNNYMTGPVTIHLNNGSSYHRHYKSTYLSIQDYSNLTNSEEFILGSHYYNLTEDYLSDLEEDYTKNQFSPYYNRTNFIIGYENYRSDLSYDEFRLIYDIIMGQVDEITPEFLRENRPIISIECRDKNGVTFGIPIYHIHQEVLDILNLPNITINDLTNFTLFDPRDEKDDVSLSAMDSQLQEAILTEMTPIYGESYYNSWALRYINTIKNVIDITEYGYFRGYLSYEAYDEILENFQ